jgi:pimeloyl-ACP methyl ester carboxylesterase
VTQTNTVGRAAEDLDVRIRPSLDPTVGWMVRAELLVPAGGAATVQVLLPGLTYDRRYWQVPGEYDYVEFMLRAGYAVLALDRLGTGQSSRPPAHQVTVDSNVEVIHRVIQKLRHGTPSGHSFDQVVTVGHAFGSGLAIVEASRHTDVDAVVLTGMLHTTVPTYEEMTDPFHAAAEDPILGDPDMPERYMTQKPGLRARMFEHAAGIDRQLSAYHELIKSTATIGEGETLPQTYLREHSVGVQCAVLLVVGEHDALLRGKDVEYPADSRSVQRFEQDFYAPEAELETHVIADTGHSLNLHRNARAGYQLTREWLDRRLGG